MTRAATLVPLSMLGQKGLVPVPLEFSGILSLSIRQNKLAVPMPFVLGPCSYVRFSRRRGKVTLSTSLPPAKVTLIASTIHPLLRTPSFNLSINEVALERAPPFDFEYPLPAFRSCLPPSAEPGIRPKGVGVGCHAKKMLQAPPSAVARYMYMTEQKRRRSNLFSKERGYLGEYGYVLVFLT